MRLRRRLRAWSGRAMSMLFERLNGKRFLGGAQTMPRDEQFVAVLPCPFQHHRPPAAGSVALNDPQRLDAHHQLRVLIDGVKMSGKRMSYHHPDDDPVEFGKH